MGKGKGMGRSLTDDEKRSATEKEVHS